MPFDNICLNGTVVISRRILAADLEESNKYDTVQHTIWFEDEENKKSLNKLDLIYVTLCSDVSA